MPHFIIDCSFGLREAHFEEYIADKIHIVTASSGLFDISDMEGRANPSNKRYKK